MQFSEETRAIVARCFEGLERLDRKGYLPKIGTIHYRGDNTIVLTAPRNAKRPIPPNDVVEALSGPAAT